MKRLKNKIYYFLCRIYDKILIAVTKSVNDPDSKNIAVIKMDLLGDGVLWLDYGIAIRQFYERQGYNVYLICNSSMESFYRSYGGFENILPFGRTELRTLGGRKKAIKTVRKISFHTVINATFSRVELKDDFFARAIKARQKIGYLGDRTNQKRIEKTGKIYDRLILPPKLISELTINAHFVKELGIDINAKHPDLSRFVQKLSLKPYAVFGLGASDLKRAWGIDNFAETANWILSSTDLEIRLIGSKNEKTLCEDFIQKVDNERIINMCGQTELPELLNVLGNAVLAVCNDTGTAHITAAVKTPGIVILGGGNNVRFFPHVSDDGTSSTLRVLSNPKDCFGCCWKCGLPLENGVWQCINDIKPARVIEEVKKIINIEE